MYPSIHKSILPPTYLYMPMSTHSLSKDTFSYPYITIHLRSSILPLATYSTYHSLSIVFPFTSSIHPPPCSATHPSNIQTSNQVVGCMRIHKEEPSILFLFNSAFPSLMTFVSGSKGTVRDLLLIHITISILVLCLGKVSWIPV